jgi:hypothetical protein
LYQPAFSRGRNVVAEMKELRIHLYSREKGKLPDRDRIELKTESYGSEQDEIIANMLEDMANWLIDEMEGYDEADFN